jgi:hypothetical protein
MITCLFYNRKHDNYFTIHEDVNGAISPREYDHKSVFVSFIDNYWCPEESGTLNDVAEHFGATYTGDITEDLDELIGKAYQKGYVLLPVWRTKQGDITISQNEFDHDLYGVIYEKITHKDAVQIREQLKIEVEEFSKWANETAYILDEYDHDGELVDEIDGVCREFAEQSNESFIVNVCDKWFGYDISESDLEEVGYEGTIEYCEKYRKKVWFELDVETRIEYHRRDDIFMRTHPKEFREDTTDKEIHVMKKYQKTITIYELPDGFMAEVHRAEALSEFYISHKRYGIKVQMFGLFTCDSETEEHILEANVAEYIALYKQDYFDYDDTEVD